MSESVYRRNPIGDFVKVLRGRSGLLNQRQGMSGASIMDRAPAFVVLEGRCNKCKGCAVPSMRLPHDAKTWDAAYKPSPKPYPTLQSVTLEFGGDFGLAQKISAVIECYTLADFKRVRDAYLLPGNYITVEFGYAGGANRWHSREQSKVTLSKFRVAVFSFSATAQGTWVCNFTAVSSATALKNTDMMSTVGTDSMTYIIAGSQEGSKTGKVKSISELIAFDAQRNGKYSIDQLQDGTVLTDSDLHAYDPGSSSILRNRNAGIAIYTGDHLRDTFGRVFARLGRFARVLNRLGDESKKTNNQVYVTLGYVVNRIINDQIMKTVKAGIGKNDKEDFEKLKIQFHPTYSKSKLPDDIRSGDPTAVLFLGSGKGNYKNNSGGGKNFEEIKSGPLSYVQAMSGTEVSLEKILLHRDVVLNCLSEAIKQRQSESDNTDVKDTQEEVINIVDFFNNISDAISEVTGGAISLRLVEDVEDALANSYMVVDQNNGGRTTLECVVLDPIDGDGSTRSCDVQSNVGSQEFKAAMFIGNSKKGDATSALRGCDDQLEDARGTKYSDAKKELNELIVNPGILGRDHFDEKQLDALKSIMVDLYRNRPTAKSYETVHWPGMSISATIDGAWGILPGCAISSKQLPDDWRQLNVYFMVTRVTHKFEGSDWTTDIEGIMSYYDKINYIPL